MFIDYLCTFLQVVEISSTFTSSFGTTLRRSVGNSPDIILSARYCLQSFYMSLNL